MEDSRFPFGTGWDPDDTLTERRFDMSDEFRRTMDKVTGPGGVHCPCCNFYTGKSRKALRRIVRRRLKYRLKRQYKEVSNG